MEVERRFPASQGGKKNYDGRPYYGRIIEAKDLETHTNETASTTSLSDIDYPTFCKALMALF
jgi:hypothetical protein